MKRQIMPALMVAALTVASAASTGAQSEVGVNPVSRVVGLLKGLAAKVEEEIKTEESLFETYVCWAKNVISTKTAFNEQATSRVDALKQYIDDLDNGRVELTTERTDLEKEVAGLKSDIEAMESARQKVREDFLAAKGEMEQAIAALEEATSVLGEATASGRREEGLLALRARLGAGQGFRARTAASVALSRAVALGERYLAAGDARFLRRVLTGDVPVRDEKRLARKADFKMKYKARSQKIQDVLDRLLSTFQTNLREAEAKEAKAQAQHETLMKSKNDALDAAEEALSKLLVEAKAREMAKTEAEDEVASLETQVENDKKYIEQTKASLESMTEEWGERKKLRIAEVGAINKAISILHSDDARDLFKQSFQSQGYLLLQQGSASSAGNGAVAAIREAALQAGDARLARLADRVAALGAGHFDAVIKAIDTMVATLQEEQEADLKLKETCESDRAEDTRQASLASREIDEMSDAITKLQAEIQEMVAQIGEAEEAIKKTEAELEEATQVREEETAAWKLSDKDDKAAIELVKQATEVLKNFYSKLGGAAALLQGRSSAGKEPAEVVAGEAPPPPPATWEQPYAGKQGASDGVVAILEMIGEDIAADVAKAKAAEEEAQAAYETFKEESEAKVSALHEDILKLEDAKGKREEAVKETTESRATKKGELDTILKKIKDSEAGCDFVAVNFEVRVKNRNLEIDGLTKAKAILQGAAFSKEPALLLQKSARK